MAGLQSTEMPIFIGGEGGIRTHGPREGTPVFKTGAFNRSATSPAEGSVAYINILDWTSLQPPACVRARMLPKLNPAGAY
jgi:hypothetical protein